jgi:hypothetical protein
MGNGPDNFFSFAGISQTSNCGSETLLPARLAIAAGDATKAGAYLPCNGRQLFEQVGVQYLPTSSRLKWVPTSLATQATVPNLVTLTNGNFVYGFARVNITSPKIAATLGRTYLSGNSSVGVIYYGVGSEGTTNSGYEILTCE